LDTPRALPDLAQLVVDTGLVRSEQVQEVLEATTDAKRLAPTLVQRGLIAGPKLAQMLSYQLCLPWVALEHVRFSPKLLRLIPVELAAKYGVIPVHVRNRTSDGRMTLYVATDDPTNQEALEACSRAARLPVRMMVATTTDVSKALAEQYGEGEFDPSHDALADTAPDGTALDVPSISRPAPDRDIAVAAARMSSPDLGHVQQLATPAAMNPTPNVVVNPPPRLGPSASSPPPPRVAASTSNTKEPSAAAPVAVTGVPRIVGAPSPTDGPHDDDLEELDALEEYAHDTDLSHVVPATASAHDDEVEKAKPQSDSSALFDASSWEPPPGAPIDVGPIPLPPPPSFLLDDGLASAPPPAGLMAPPPPPPPAPLIGDSIPPEDLDVELNEEDIEEEPSSPTTPQPRHAAPLDQEEHAVFVVGADDDFIRQCHRAFYLLPVRMVSGALMSAEARAKEVNPVVIVVPADVYAFDRYAFYRLAFEAGCPLLVWEREFGPEQVSVLVEATLRKAEQQQG
jgi:type IV pilus assembly protein PilB